MENLIKMLNDRQYRDTILRDFEAAAKNENCSPTFYQTILNSLRIDPYYVYSDDHRDWLMGVAQDKIKARCEDAIKGA
jgi:hypothetical protein